MRSIHVYTIGEDPLPKEGLEIILIEESSSFGIFSRMSTTEGVVEYNYDTLGYSSLEEALKEREVALEWVDCDDNGELHDLICFVDSADNQLTKGIYWMYVHEFYPTVSKIQWPFQDRGYFNAAVKHELITVKEIVNREVVGRGKDTFDYYTEVCVFDNGTFAVEWCNERFMNATKI